MPLCSATTSSVVVASVTILVANYFVALLLPPLAADLEVLEDAASRPSAPVDCPIRTYGGKDDPLVSTEELAQWEPFTRAQFSTRRFPGDHFYLAVLASELLTDICSHLRTTPTFR